MKDSKHLFKKIAVTFACILLPLLVASVVIASIRQTGLSGGVRILFSWLYTSIRILLVFDLKFYILVVVVLVLLYLVDLYRKHRKGR
jgi:hypothetical protein